MKTCQNIFESCHEPIGANPYDLCDGCLWWNALRAVRQIAKFEDGDNYGTNLSYVKNWLAFSRHAPGLKALSDFTEAMIENSKRKMVFALLTLESELLNETPEGMRDNQPSISDILNLPF